MELQAHHSDTLPAATAAATAVPASRSKFWTLILRQILMAALIAMGSYATFEFVTHYVLQSVQVVGASMTPTLHDSERYVLNRFVYHVRDPQPQEIVVLRDPADDCYAVKRIVAKQGDRVLVKEGHLYVNGQLLSEPYLPANTPTFAAPRYREQLWICGTNQFFVLGDNRLNSADSRVYGAIHRDQIIGMVIH